MVVFKVLTVVAIAVRLMLLSPKVGEMGGGGREKYVQCPKCKDSWWEDRFAGSVNCPSCGAKVKV